MPADAQDTHIMKAHLRKHKVFHNIADTLENVVFNNSLGDLDHGSQHLVETSFRRFERTSMRTIKKEIPLVLVGGAESSSSSGGVFGNPTEIAREARSAIPAVSVLNTQKGNSGKLGQAMKRYSTKADLAANRYLRKEGNASRNLQPTAGKIRFSPSSDSTDCGKR